MKSLKGHFLIASPKLADPNFARTIVLVIQHDKDGTLGLVINRPLEMSIKSAWEQVSHNECAAEGYLHRGGPCDGPLMVIHTEQEASEVQIIDGVYFTTEREAIEKLVIEDVSPMRFFVGYSGWGKGQLESELQEGSWMVLPASSEQIFAEEDHWPELMKAIMRSTELPGVNPKCIPEDPSLN